VPSHVERARDTPTRLDGPAIGPGDWIGRYRIRDVLAGGGMGLVYKASDRDLGRRIAIKVLHGRGRTDLAFTGRRERLLREAQALAQLSHPNIVSVYDVGKADDRLFVAMEYVEGHSLRDWLAERPRSVAEILSVFVQAGRGLAAAHASGIIHRDFKPTNVLVGIDGRVRVVDFGLARGLYDDCAQGVDGDVTRPGMLSTPLTDANIVLGTMGYISPEQLLERQATPRSDQFSFCVALYEALYGERPYPGNDVIQIASRYREGRIEPLAGRTGVPRRIHRCLLRGLQTDPEERYPSMTALLRDLDRRPTQHWRHLAATTLILATAWIAAYAAVWFHQSVFPGAQTTRPPDGHCSQPKIVNKSP
jgi:serine/threonine protein kinase